MQSPGRKLANWKKNYNLRKGVTPFTKASVITICLFIDMVLSRVKRDSRLHYLTYGDYTFLFLLDTTHMF